MVATKRRCIQFSFVFLTLALRSHVDAFMVINQYGCSPSPSSFGNHHRRTYGSAVTTTSTVYLLPPPKRINNPVDKGFNLLEIASQIIPQGTIVSTAKESWRLLWTRFMVELAPQDREGNYQRPQYPFQGKTIGSQQHPIETNRYHVYVGNPCPWCHRVRLVVNILNLQQNNGIGMTMLVDDPVKASRGGWIFATPPIEALPSKIQDLRQLYEYLSPGYQGRCTAPLLVDWKTRTILSNESKDIIRMIPLLLKGLDVQSKNEPTTEIDLVPGNLQGQIDETNEWIYTQINNGVYQCGFATTQQAYNRASGQVLEGLNRVESILSQQSFLCGETITESDILLLPTMLRFDTVYSPLFGAGGSRHWKLQPDFPNIHSWMKRCWNDISGVSTSIDLDDASKSYYKQLFPLNPGGIVPMIDITPQRLGLE